MKSLLPRKRLLRIAILALVLLAVSGGTVAVLTRSGGGNAVPRSGLTAKVDQDAVDWATSAHVPSPSTVEWIGTTRQRADELLFHLHLRGTAGARPVFAIEICGGGTYVFPAPRRSPASAEHPPRGSVLVVVVLQSSFVTVDAGLLPKLISLSSLGAPESDSLEGLRVISSEEWRARYG
jgi:hypothetical protein